FSRGALRAADCAVSAVWRRTPAHGCDNPVPPDTRPYPAPATIPADAETGGVAVLPATSPVRHTIRSRAGHRVELHRQKPAPDAACDSVRAHWLSGGRRDPETDAARLIRAGTRTASRGIGTRFAAGRGSRIRTGSPASDTAPDSVTARRV